jgi:hypothetical protein
MIMIIKIFYHTAISIIQISKNLLKNMAIHMKYKVTYHII